MCFFFFISSLLVVCACQCGSVIRVKKKKIKLQPSTAFTLNGLATHTQHYTDQETSQTFGHSERGNWGPQEGQHQP